MSEERTETEADLAELEQEKEERIYDETQTETNDKAEELVANSDTKESNDSNVEELKPEEVQYNKEEVSNSTRDPIEGLREENALLSSQRDSSETELSLYKEKVKSLMEEQTRLLKEADKQKEFMNKKLNELQSQARGGDLISSPFPWMVINLLLMVIICILLTFQLREGKELWESFFDYVGLRRPSGPNPT
eukprot:TRINITY_DN8415_c0_g1_i1.p1 TRINITY_DN8415_c0_g1~~TRINITY_DN8415_c0_g1_i1.p1  ORF type:complete len:203 (-),score=59.38 TRINITY_DN8415_c0_g1_i1:114-689(-)